MSQADRQKWNEKFRQNPALIAPRAPSKLLAEFIESSDFKNAKALDLACGGGRHTIYLAQKGWYVDGVDISSVALEKLADSVDLKRVKLIEADLDNFKVEDAYYDLIVMSNFLDRELIDRAKRWLKRGGYFFVETYMADEANQKKDSNPDYLLKEGELKRLLGDFEMIEYREFWNESYEKYQMRKQGILARKR